jgi:AmiR/NasT family two-component response regulator
MSATFHQLRDSLDMLDVCHKIVPWLTLDEIGSKIREAQHAQRAAFTAHGFDDQELRTQLQLMCEAIKELNALRRDVERGLGR